MGIPDGNEVAMLEGPFDRIVSRWAPKFAISGSYRERLAEGFLWQSLQDLGRPGLGWDGMTLLRLGHHSMHNGCRTIIELRAVNLSLNEVKCAS